MIVPWTVRITDDQVEINVRIPNPVTYIAQKLLVLKNRRREDRAKDILYIHDMLELYGAELTLLNRTWHESIQPEIGKTAADVVNLPAQYYAEVTDDIRRAARVAGDRDLAPETLRLRCDVGLRTVFETP